MLSNAPQAGQPFMTPTQMRWALSQVEDVLGSQFGIKMDDIFSEALVFPDEFLSRIVLNRKLNNIPEKFCRLGMTPDGKEEHGWAFEYVEVRGKSPEIHIRYFNSADAYYAYKNLNISDGKHHGQGICCSDCAAGIKHRNSKAKSRPANRPTSPEERAKQHANRLRVQKARRANKRGKK